jgi:hypothetical protein
MSQQREDVFDAREDEVLGAMMRAVRPQEPEAPEFSRMWARASYEAREEEAAHTSWMALVAFALLAIGFALVYLASEREVPVARTVERASASEVQQHIAREHRALESNKGEMMTWEAPTDFLLAGPLDDESGLMSDAPSFGEASL